MFYPTAEADIVPLLSQRLFNSAADDYKGGDKNEFLNIDG